MDIIRKRLKAEHAMNKKLTDARADFLSFLEKIFEKQKIEDIENEKLKLNVEDFGHYFEDWRSIAHHETVSVL